MKLFLSNPFKRKYLFCIIFMFEIISFVSASKDIGFEPQVKAGFNIEGSQGLYTIRMNEEENFQGEEFKSEPKGALDKLKGPSDTDCNDPYKLNNCISSDDESSRLSPVPKSPYKTKKSRSFSRKSTSGLDSLKGWQYLLLASAAFTFLSILIYSVYYIVLIRKIYAKERVAE